MKKRIFSLLLVLSMLMSLWVMPVAAEQKARTTYDNILRLVDDPDVRDVIKFLRAREIVHYQRFGEGLRIATDKMDCKNFYAFNPAFDKNFR